MNSLNKILNQEIELIRVDKDNLNKIKKIGNDFCAKLNKKLKKSRIDAQVFIGGSLAKTTLVKKKIQDIDIFVRFNNKYDSEKISLILGKILGKNIKKIHGSRDYYQILIDNVIIEIIPVMKIKNPADAYNITDLSYFHVKYILKKLKQNKNLNNEIILAKTFAHSCECYGAESYINGFSGYALELLICHYKSFLKFLKAITNIREDKINIIDDAEFYKNKNVILRELGNSKTQSPIILIDPTFKQRNALAGLSKETFLRFKKYCSEFLKNPSHKFFKKHFVSEEFEKYEDVKIIEVVTNKQAGDIAGSKSKKFFKFFNRELGKEFEVKKSGFEYNGEINTAKFYFVLNKKKDEEVRGPSLNNKNNFKRFKKAHKDVIIKNGFGYIKIKHELSFEHWFKRFLKKQKEIIRQMNIGLIKKV